MANKKRNFEGLTLGKLTCSSICIEDKNGKRLWWWTCECMRGQITKLTVKQINERERRPNDFKLMCDKCKLDGLKQPDKSKKQWEC